MKYCAHCGSELFEEAVVCPKCGCQVRDFNFNATNQEAKNENTTSKSAQKKTNTMALVGFILSFIIPLLGLIFSCIGKNQLAQNPEEEGETLAKAGIIISAIALGLSVLSSIVGVIAMLVIMGIVII